MAQSSGRVALLLLGVAGCGSRTGLLASDLAPDASCTADAAPATGCGPVPGGDLPPDVSVATGGVTGSSLRVAFCPGAVYARVTRAVAGPEPYFFVLDGFVGTTTVVNPFEFQSPAGAAGGLLSVLVDLSSNEPGDYTSARNDDFGIVSFTYDVPVPCFDCGSTAPVSSPAECAPGCSTVCAHFGCEPCRPKWPRTTYGASSWEFVLTSDPQGADSGQGLTYFTPHGSFTATLASDTDGGTQMATLAASF
jgi:hypothetical protein